MLVVDAITLEDNLEQLAAAINQAQWDEANDLVTYEAAALRAYLERQDTVFVVCYDVEGSQRTLLGIASGRIEIKPYEHERWLYVDEVDVSVAQRRKGAGKAIVRKLIAIAEAADCEEVWLGTELDNLPANALYQSLNPEEIQQFVGYTFDPDDYTSQVDD